MYSAAVVLFSLAIVVPNVYSQTVDCSGPPPMGVRPSECCTSMKKCPFLKLSSEVLQKCGLPPMPEHGPGAGPPPSGPRGPPACEAIQCLMTQDNLLDANKKVNQAALQTYLEQSYGAEWKDGIQKTVQTCASELNANTDSCEARQFMGCLKHKLFLNCPASSWTSSTECNNLKAHIQSCPFPGGMMG